MKLLTVVIAVSLIIGWACKREEPPVPIVRQFSFEENGVPYALNGKFGALDYVYYYADDGNFNLTLYVTPERRMELKINQSVQAGTQYSLINSADGQLAYYHPSGYGNSKDCGTTGYVKVTEFDQTNRRIKAEFETDLCGNDSTMKIRKGKIDLPYTLLK